MSEGSGFEICQIIGQNQARVKFFSKIATGVKGAYPSLWKVKVGSGPR